MGAGKQSDIPWQPQARFRYASQRSGTKLEVAILAPYTSLSAGVLRMRCLCHGISSSSLRPYLPLSHKLQRGLAKCTLYGYAIYRINAI